MKAVERSLRAELRSMGVSLRSSALARAGVDLARRLDAGPGDRSAVQLSRELRMVMVALRAQSRGGSGDVEAFLAGCPPRHSTPATDRPSFGGKVVATAGALGWDAMPWQAAGGAHRARA